MCALTPTTAWGIVVDDNGLTLERSRETWMHRTLADDTDTERKRRLLDPRGWPVRWARSSAAVLRCTDG